MGTNHPHHHRHLSSLTNQEIAALANLLALPRRVLHPTTGAPSVLWLATQECLITSTSPTFPKTLQRPHDILSRLFMSANRCLHLHLDDVIPECAVLCSAHRELNPWIVRRVYRLIVQEATGRGEVGVVERYLAKPGQYHCLSIYGEIDGDGTENLKRTRSSNTNNVTRLDGSTVSEMRDFMNRMLVLVRRSRMGANSSSSEGDDVGGAIKIKHQRTQTTSDEPTAELRSTCEACFVATIGADATALCDLRASLRARAHKRNRKRRRTRTQMKVMAGGKTKRGGEMNMVNNYNNNGNSNSKSGRSEKPALLRLVDAWIANLSYDDEGERIGTGRGGQEDLFKESERLAVIVRSVRRAVRKWEKERRRGIGLDHDHDHQHQRLHGRYHYNSDHEHNHDQRHSGDRNYNDGPGTFTSLDSRRSETTRRHVAAACANTAEQHDAEWRYSNNALLRSEIDGQLDAWKAEGFGEEHPIISSHCPSPSPGGGSGSGDSDGGLDTRQQEESSFWRTSLPVISTAFVPSWVYEYRRQREHHQQYRHAKSLDTSRTLTEKNEGGDYCENDEKQDHKNKNKNNDNDNDILAQHSEMAGKTPTDHRRISYTLSATVSCVDTIDDLLESYHRSEWGVEESDYLLEQCWDDEEEEDEDDDDDA